jgi:hypothetical protein
MDKKAYQDMKSGMKESGSNWFTTGLKSKSKPAKMPGKKSGGMKKGRRGC